MYRLERLYRISQLLAARRVVTTQDFLDDLEISLATFKRDLEYLRDRLQRPFHLDLGARMAIISYNCNTAMNGN